MIEENINPKLKIWLAKGGDALVFGEDSGARRRMSDEDAVNLFQRVWTEILEPAVRAAPKISIEEAKELLEGKQQIYATANSQYRQFSISSAVFVAKLNVEATDSGLCDQLWSIGAHRDNTRLCMYFETVVERESFESLAKQLGYEKGASLAVELARDFARKFRLSR